MNHESEAYEQLPTARHLFHGGSEIALLLGRFSEFHSEHEHIREYIIEDFPTHIKAQWPELQSLTYIPSYVVDDSPTDDMVWVTLSDNVVERDYMIGRDATGDYGVEVEYSVVEPTDVREIAEIEKAGMDKAINYLFNDVAHQDDIDFNLVEKLDFLLRQDRTASPADIMMLGEIIRALSDYSKSKKQP